MPVNAFCVIFPPTIGTVPTTVDRVTVVSPYTLSAPNAHSPLTADADTISFGLFLNLICPEFETNLALFNPNLISSSCTGDQVLLFDERNSIPE